jgi:hypothetical protein
MEFNHDDFFEEYLEDLTCPYVETDPKVLIKKEIGDRVEVIDYSSVTNENGEEFEGDDYNNVEFNMMFIVIETNLRNQYKTTFVTYQQDLIIVDPKTKRKYRVSSNHVRVL